MVSTIVHDGPAAEVDVHLADDEDEPVHVGVKIRLRHLHRPQELGAAALHEAEIAGVIDAGAKIRVLVIDADRQGHGRRPA
jgi:hypothetical protein